MSGLTASLIAGVRARRSSVTLERILPVGVAALVAAASFLSVLPSGPATAVGGTVGGGIEPRIIVGGLGDQGGAGGAGRDTPERPNHVPGGSVDEGEVFRPLLPADTLPDPIAGTIVDATPVSPAPELAGPFLSDGTLLTGFAPNTTVEDGSDLLRRYRVRAGDTLTGIASRHGVSMMTVWWANDLKAKDDLVVGKVLVIPPVSGLVVDVTAGDSLATLASKYRVDEKDILEANGLDDPNLVVGQTLIVPGALGDAIATPKPKPATPSRPRTNTGGGGGGGSVRPPATYGGGAMVWPVVGGGNYISQYYHYGHYGVDIAADYGSRVRAAAGGKVIFAGWKSNGGGYQVWVAHGGGLYTTYNHMSGVSVGRGQTIAKGQAVGRIGCSGWCTGPHLHFEVWRGEIWNGGRRVNPLGFL